MKLAHRSFLLPFGAALAGFAGAVESNGGGRTAPTIERDPQEDVDDAVAVGADGHLQRTPEDPALYRFKKVPDSHLQKLSVLSQAKEDNNAVGINVAATSGGADTVELLRQRASAAEVAGSSRLEGTSHGAVDGMVSRKGGTKDECAVFSDCVDKAMKATQPATYRAACVTCHKVDRPNCECTDCAMQSDAWWDELQTNFSNGGGKESELVFLQTNEEKIQASTDKCNICRDFHLDSLQGCTTKDDIEDIYFVVEMRNYWSTGGMPEKKRVAKEAFLCSLVEFMLPQKGEPAEDKKDPNTCVNERCF